MIDDARTLMLAAIARATDAVRDRDVEDAYGRLERGYRHSDQADGSDRLELLSERLRDYGVQVLRAHPDDIAATVAAWAQSRSVRAWVVPDGLDPSYLAATRDARTVAQSADARDLDGADAVITTCALAIAETGTIVLDAGPGQGPRAVSLIPDVHLCIVHGERVVGLVSEAIAALIGSQSTTRPITLISGPSATSDIELVRVAGVHGPRTLAVLMVDVAGAAAPGPR